MSQPTKISQSKLLQMHHNGELLFVSATSKPLDEILEVISKTDNLREYAVNVTGLNRDDLRGASIEYYEEDSVIIATTPSQLSLIYTLA